MRCFAPASAGLGPRTRGAGPGLPPECVSGKQRTSLLMAAQAREAARPSLEDACFINPPRNARLAVWTAHLLD